MIEIATAAWVLLVPPYGHRGVTYVPFRTEQACLAAKKWVIEMSSDFKPKVECFPLGEK